MVRSTVNVVAFRGILTEAPVEEVSVMVLTSTLKESRLVLGGGVSGAAVNVKLTVAVPPTPPPGDGEFFGPLHATREMADIESSEARTVRKFMSPHGERVPGPRLGEAQASQTQLYTGVCDEQTQNESRLLKC